MLPVGSQPVVDSGFVGGGSDISSVPAVLAASGGVGLTAGLLGLAAGVLFACCAMAVEWSCDEIAGVLEHKESDHQVVRTGTNYT